MQSMLSERTPEGIHVNLTIILKNVRWYATRIEDCILQHGPRLKIVVRWLWSDDNPAMQRAPYYF